MVYRDWERQIRKRQRRKFNWWWLLTCILFVASATIDVLVIIWFVHRFW